MNVTIHRFDDASPAEVPAVAPLPALDWAWHLEQFKSQVVFGLEKCRLCLRNPRATGRTVCNTCRKKADQQRWKTTAKEKRREKTQHR